MYLPLIYPPSPARIREAIEEDAEQGMPSKEMRRSAERLGLSLFKFNTYQSMKPQNQGGALNPQQRGYGKKMHSIY